MNRRQMMAGLMLPLLGFDGLAQQAARVRRLGWLSNTHTDDSPERQAISDAFRNELRRRGWAEGRDIEIVYRHANGAVERFPALADVLVRSKVDVIVAVSNPPHQRRKRRPLLFQSC